MQRRPWPLVFLAIFQLLGPIGSIFISALMNKVGIIEMTTAIWNYSRPIDLLEFYALPVMLGGFIFLAKRWGYYIVLALACFSIYLNIREWRVASDVISLPVLMGVIAANIALIVYLLLPNVRAVFMNSRLRWWETPPRYLVSIKALVSKNDGHAKPARIADLSVGGAGIETESELFQSGDTVLVTYEHDGRTVLMRATAVYSRYDGTGYRYGIEWQRGSEDDERRTMRFIDELESKKTTICNPPPQWSDDLKAWWLRAKRDPGAWIPEITKKK